MKVDTQINQDLTNSLLMRIDTNIIEHLGIKMYRNLPSVLAELVSNSYDADATWIKIEFFEYNGQKQIKIVDNGTGMDFNELNEKFLYIARNRRNHGENISPKGRLVTGRKGLGKLSIFGVADEIQVDTIKNGYQTRFTMNLKDILTTHNGNYTPKIDIHNQPSSSERTGTEVILKAIKRPKVFDIDSIKESLTKRFYFNNEDFTIFLKFGDKEETINKDSKWQYAQAKYSWNFPSDDFDDNQFASDHKINGKIIVTEKGLTEDRKGIVLYARNKMVNNNEFYGIRGSSSSFIYNNLTGVLNVDFVDDFEEDLVMTNRSGLMWDSTELAPLRKWLQSTLICIEKQCRKLREEDKKANIIQKIGKDPQEWVDDLPKRERKIAQKLVNSITSEENIDGNKAADLIEYIQQSFQFEAFKDFAEELEHTEIDDVKLLELFKEWNIIELREFYKLSIGRIKAIEKLEKFEFENAKEVPTIHNFIKEFPWLLDPRMTIFKDECHYTEILKEKFPDHNIPEEELPAENRRLDFLCVGFGDTLYVIELKRPKIKVSTRELQQLKAYCSFIKKHHIGTSEYSYSNVSGYIIAGGRVDSYGIEEDIEGMKSQRMYLKTYKELISQARNYHQEFLAKYKEFKKSV